tara:strand:+ start:2670 stop:3575 length:906 start_codon:yes stop_codon:yes gene_type:complete
MTAKQKGLGRGLDSLISSNTKIYDQSSENLQKNVSEIVISEIVPSPWQPRKIFDEEPLNDLVLSIKEHGILQPLVVRKTNDKYELVAGERRWRAAQLASLKKVPIVLIEVDDKKALEIALVENLQREDLNPIEEARGYALLKETFNLTQEQVSERVGKGRTTITNALRLLDLSDFIQEKVSLNILSVGHAKVLLKINDLSQQNDIAQNVIKENLSVRALEKIVRRLGLPPKKKRAEKVDIPNEYLKSLTENLHKYLGSSVKIIPSKTLTNGKKIKGSVQIDYYDNDELDRMLQIIGYEEEL